MAELHIEQCSLKLEDKSDAHNLADVEKALARNPDAAGFTELRRSEFASLGAVCRKHGYQLIHPDRSDVAVAVRNAHKVLDRGVIQNIAPGRDLVWATFQFGENIVSFHETHWHTIHADAHHESADAQTSALIHRVTADAMGTRLSFYGGDTNHDMRHDNPIKAALEGAHLPTIQMALNEWETTHGKGGVIDVVGYDSLDRRVHAEKVVVWPLGFSDHHAVSGFFSIVPMHHHARHTGKPR